MRPTPTDLLATPELAALHVLATALDTATTALRAAHRDALDLERERERALRCEPVSAAAVVARAIIDHGRLVRSLLDDYEPAIEADQARELADENGPF